MIDDFAMLCAPPRQWLGVNNHPHEEDVELMNKLRTIGLLAVTALMSLGTLALAAPAHADTTWACPSCFSGPTTQR